MAANRGDWRGIVGWVRLPLLNGGLRMNRRDLLVSATGCGLAAMLPPAVHAAMPRPGDGDAAFGNLIMRIAADSVTDHPEWATNARWDVGAHAALRHRLNDRSPAARLRLLERTKAAIAAVEAVDPGTLSAPSARYRQIYLYDGRSRIVAPERFGVASLDPPFVLTQQWGAYFTIPEFLNNKHPVASTADADAYLDRTRAFAVALDQDSDAQAAEARRGYLAPGFVLDTVLAQLATLRAPAGADNPLTRSLVRRTTGKIPGDWSARCTAMVQDAVYPALDRQIALVRRLRAEARMSAGVWDVPDDEALYAAALEAATTGTIAPAELYRIGVEQMAAIKAELDTLLVAQGLTRGTVGERLLELSRRPDLCYPDTADGRAEILRDAAALTDAMRPWLAILFDHPPEAPLRIEAAPAEVEDGASHANYYPATNASTPGRLRLNLKALAGSPRFALPALVYHEGIPGHHLQKSYALHGMGMRFTAYAEGWALYAERLADQLGGYATPLDRIGYLQSRLFRAARLVVDTGIHARRWSREQATAFLVEETGTPLSQSQREVDRYCVRPGQACSYMVGYLAWMRALEGARRRLGTRFDMKAFHDVLRSGELPLPMLERLIAERTGGGK